MANIFDNTATAPSIAEYFKQFDIVVSETTGLDLTIAPGNIVLTSGALAITAQTALSLVDDTAVNYVYVSPVTGSVEISNVYAQTLNSYILYMLSTASGRITSCTDMRLVYAGNSTGVAGAGITQLLAFYNASLVDTLYAGSLVTIASMADGTYDGVATGTAITSVHLAEPMYVVTADILPGATGYVTQRGFVAGLDTSALTVNELYVDVSTFALTNTVPTAAEPTVKAGYVILVSATDGIIYIDMRVVSTEASRSLYTADATPAPVAGTVAAALDAHVVAIGQALIDANAYTDGVADTRALLGGDAAQAFLALTLNGAYIAKVGTNNFLFGSNVGNATMSGQSNIVSGVNSLALATTATGNNAHGANAGAAITTGSYNTLFGQAAGDGIVGGSYNTLFGMLSACGLVSGDNNTILGARVTGLAADLASNIIIADGAGNIRARYNGGWVLAGNPFLQVANLGTDVETALAFNVGSAGAVLTTATGAAIAGSASQAFATSYVTQAGNRTPFHLPVGTGFVGLPSSGSFADNGALTLTTALPNGNITQAYLYFPANAIHAGSAAGLYWCVFSSTTAAQVFQELYTGGAVVAPAAPTPFVCVGSGAYTQTTGVTVVLPSVTVPANALGDAGILDYTALFITPENTNTKTAGSSFGATAAIAYPVVGATSASIQMDAFIKNLDATHQLRQASFSRAGQVTAFGFCAEDTTTAKDLSFSGKLAVDTDYIIVAMLNVMVSPQ